MMERVGDRWEKMEGSCSTGQSPQWAVVPVEEEKEEEEEEIFRYSGMSGCVSVLVDSGVTSKRRYAVTRCRRPD
jgi:hypothetical protein